MKGLKARLMAHMIACHGPMVDPDPDNWTLSGLGRLHRLVVTLERLGAF